MLDAAKSDTPRGEVVLMHGKPDEMNAALAPLLAVAEGVHMTRDLVNEPANVLTTSEFADRLAEAGFGVTTRAAAPLGGGGPSGPAPAIVMFDLDTRPAN